MKKAPKFSIGDAVTFTNQQGVVFPGKTIVAIDTDEWFDKQPRYFIQPTDTPWFSFAESELSLSPSPAKESEKV